MTIDSANLITLITDARRGLLATALTQDRHLTLEGLRARQRREVEAIRARLAMWLPTVPTAPGRQPVLDALTPKGADDLALQAHEWAKVRALREAGRELPAIIADADRTRLAAILDHLETAPEVLEDSQPASVVEFIEGVIWDRLVQVDTEAEKVAAAEVATLPARAWRALLEGTATTGALDYDGLVLLREADQVAFDLLIDADAEAVPGPSGNSIGLLMESLERSTVDA